MNVPTFSAEDTDDLGNSARSYLRQVEVTSSASFVVVKARQSGSTTRSTTAFTGV